MNVDKITIELLNKSIHAQNVLIELLKKQLNELESKPFDGVIKKQYEPTNTVFEVGKWYKFTPPTHESKLIFCVTELRSNHVYGYGITNLGNWCVDTHFTNQVGCDWRHATHDEIFETLKNEAIKRGFKKGVTVKRPKSFNVNICNGGDEIVEINHSGFYLHDPNNSFEVGGRVIFKNGVWAEIIEPETIKVGEYKVEKINDVYQIGCKFIEKTHLEQLLHFMKSVRFQRVSFDGHETDIETIEKILKI